MSNPVAKKSESLEARIGDISAMQPLSGIVRVDESGAVNGLGHGAFVRVEKIGKATGKAR